MPATRITPTVRILLIINVAAFLLHLVADKFLGFRLLEAFALIPQQLFEGFQVWRLFTYMFMHADLFHLLFNMLVLWMIGSELEGQWGRRFFLTYYFVCGLSGGLFYMIVQLFLRGSQANLIPMVGSSGAVYGLLVAYGILFAERTLLFMMIFPMKAKHFVLVLAGIEFISTVFYSGSGVANAAHLGGMIVGFLFLFLSAWMRVRSRQAATGQPRRRMKSKHLKLVVNNRKGLAELDDDDDSEKPTFH